MRIKTLILAVILFGNSCFALDGNFVLHGNISLAHRTGHVSRFQGGSSSDPRRDIHRTDLMSSRVEMPLPRKISVDPKAHAPARSNVTCGMRVIQQPVHQCRREAPAAYQRTIHGVNVASDYVQRIIYEHLDSLLAEFESYFSSSPAIVTLNLDKLRFSGGPFFGLSQEDRFCLNNLIPDLNQAFEVLKSEIGGALQCDGWFNAELTELQKQYIAKSIVNYLSYNCPEAYKHRLDQFLNPKIIEYSQRPLAACKDNAWSRGVHRFSIKKFNNNCIQVGLYNLRGDYRGAQGIVDQYKHKPELHCTIKAISEEAKSLYQAKLSRQKTVAHSPKTKNKPLSVEPKKTEVSTEPQRVNSGREQVISVPDVVSEVSLLVESVDEFKNNHPAVSEQQIEMQEIIVETAKQSVIAHNASSSVFDNKVCKFGDQCVEDAQIFNINAHIEVAKQCVEIAQTCFSFVIEKACVIGGEMYSYTGEIIIDPIGYARQHIEGFIGLLDYIIKYPDRVGESIKNGTYQHPVLDMQDNARVLGRHMKSMSADDWCKGAAHFVVDGVVFAGTGYAAKRGLRAGRTLAKAAVVRSQKTAKWVQNITRAPKKVSFAATAEGTMHRVPVEQLESGVVSSAEKSLATVEKNAVKASSRIDIAGTKKSVKKLMNQGIIPKETGQEIMRQLDLPRCDAHGLVTKRGSHKWIPSELQELVISNETIEKLCKSYGKNLGYEHLFTPELMYNCEKNILEGAGWHHDYLGRVLKSGKVKIQNFTKGPHGTYKFDWSYGNSLFKESTFFPISWSESKVLSKINEAMGNVIESKVKNNKRVVIGLTSEGLKIQAVFKMVNDTLEKMITAYPDL